MTPGPYALAGLLGGLLAVERKAFLQAMLSRPLVAGALVGLLFGQPLAGLSAGAMLELFFMGAVNFGAALPDNELFATLAATASACAALTQMAVPAPAALTLSTLLALPLAKVGKRVDRRCEHANQRCVGHALEAAPARRRVRRNLEGLALPFLFGFVVTSAAALAGGALLAPFLRSVPPRAIQALAQAWPVLFIASAAIAVRAIHTGRAALYAGLAALAAGAAQVSRLFVSG